MIDQLKQPAIKEQHWRRLIEITGKDLKFDIKTITLDQVFQLELHLYGERVDEICQEASEEQKNANKLS